MSEPTITDEFMREQLGRTREYTLVLLQATPARQNPDADALVWEHGRRNFELRREGVLAIVGPLQDDGPIVGMGIFTTDPAETAEIMDGDPAVKAGIFTYEVHPVRSFPGDALPG
jgi:YCII-related domain